MTLPSVVGGSSTPRSSTSSSVPLRLGGLLPSVMLPPIAEVRVLGDL